MRTVSILNANSVQNNWRRGGRCRFVGLAVDSITTNHATRPSPRRRSMMLMPNSVLIRLSRYQTMYSSSMPTNLSIETPVKLRLWKNSCLSRPKKPLRGRVVRRTAFRAHRTRQTMLLADADPLGPPVVAATVGMDDRLLPVPERGARVGEHAVGQCRVRAGADRPRDGKLVVAVDHGRQIGLARGNREPGRVRDPQPVRTLGVEIPVRQVLRRLGGLALV